MTVRKIVSAILVILVACVVVGALLIWKPQIDPVETAKASAGGKRSRACRNRKLRGLPYYARR